MTCPYCASTHAGICPRVKSIEYADDGVTVRKVEFYGPVSIDWPTVAKLGPSIRMPYWTAPAAVPAYSPSVRDIWGGPINPSLEFVPYHPQNVQ